MEKETFQITSPVDQTVYISGYWYNRQYFKNHECVDGWNKSSVAFIRWGIDNSWWGLKYRGQHHYEPLEMTAGQTIDVGH